MFLPTLRNQTSAAQRAAWLPAAKELAIIGCYGQTEMAHGSDGKEGTETEGTETEVSRSSGSRVGRCLLKCLSITSDPHAPRLIPSFIFPSPPCHNPSSLSRVFPLPPSSPVARDDRHIQPDHAHLRPPLPQHRVHQVVARRPWAHRDARNHPRPPSPSARGWGRGRRPRHRSEAFLRTGRKKKRGLSYRRCSYAVRVLCARRASAPATFSPLAFGSIVPLTGNVRAHTQSQSEIL